MHKYTHKYRAGDPWITRFGQRSADGTSKSKRRLCVSPEISERVLVERSTGAHGPEAGTDMCERCRLSLRFRLI